MGQWIQASILESALDQELETLDFNIGPAMKFSYGCSQIGSFLNVSVFLVRHC